MIARATAIDLVSRGIGKLYNHGRRPVIRFTMTEGRTRVAKLIEAEGICPTCTEDYHCPVSGRPWSHVDHIHIMRVHNGRDHRAAQ